MTAAPRTLTRFTRLSSLPYDVHTMKRKDSTVMTIPTHQWPRLMTGIVALLLAWTSGCLVLRFGTDYRFANDLIEHALWGLPLLLLSVSVVAGHAARTIRT